MNIEQRFMTIRQTAAAGYDIGLSYEMLKRGPEYTQFLFLHELTHIFGGGEHSPEFHRKLDRMIERFNQKTGSSIVNDYCP